MKLFIDTANIEEIRKASELGIVKGVTTNPSLIAKEGRKLEDVIKEIVSLVDGPISAEVDEGTADHMVSQARELAKIHKNIVIKHISFVRKSTNYLMAIINLIIWQ